VGTNRGPEIAEGTGGTLVPSEVNSAINLPDKPIDFGDQSVGGRKTSSFSIESAGKLDLKITAFDFGGNNPSDFKYVDGDCRSRPIKTRCSVSLAFEPSGVGERRATLLITHNSTPSQSSLELVGIGTLGGTIPGGTGTTPTTTIELKIDATAQGTSFAIQKVGSSATRQVSIRNTGQATVKIDKVSVAGNGKDAFVSNNQCNEPIAPNGTCTLDVIFTPQTPDGFTANLSITATEVNPMATVPRTVTLPPVELKGTGGVPVIRTDQSDLCFSKQKVVKNTDPKVRESLTLSVANTGSVPLTVTDVAVSNDDFTITEDTCKGKDIGAECRVTVGFTPRKSRLRQGVLTITHDDKKATPTRIPLKGVGRHRNLLVQFFQSLKRTKGACK
jgi:hypothetical protein